MRIVILAAINQPAYYIVIIVISYSALLIHFNVQLGFIDGSQRGQDGLRKIRTMLWIVEALNLSIYQGVDVGFGFGLDILDDGQLCGADIAACAVKEEIGPVKHVGFRYIAVLQVGAASFRGGIDC